MVQAMVNVPQALSAIEFTTAIASPASAVTMMKSVAPAVVTAASLPMYRPAMLCSASPPCRTEAKRMTRSCTDPARTAPRTIQSAGHEAELRREDRPNQGARSGDGGEMVPEDHEAAGLDRDFGIPIAQPGGNTKPTGTGTASGLADRSRTSREMDSTRSGSIPGSPPTQSGVWTATWEWAAPCTGQSAGGFHCPSSDGSGPFLTDSFLQANSRRASSRSVTAYPRCS